MTPDGSMTEEEVSALIEENRKRLRETHEEQMRQRELQQLIIEAEGIPEDEMPDEELRTRRYTVTADGTAGEF